MLALGAVLLLVGLLMFGAIAAMLGLILRAALFVVLLPFRLVFAIVPMFIVGVVLFCVFGALLLVGGGLLVGLLAMLASLAFPVLLVAGVIWLFVHLLKRPAVVA